MSLYSLVVDVPCSGSSLASTSGEDDCRPLPMLHGHINWACLDLRKRDSPPDGLCQSVPGEATSGPGAREVLPATIITWCDADKHTSDAVAVLVPHVTSDLDQGMVDVYHLGDPAGVTACGCGCRPGPMSRSGRRSLSAGRCCCGQSGWSVCARRCCCRCASGTRRGSGRRLR
jgi:hypothetical protein